MTFAVDGVIAGWGEGLQLMFEGEKTRFWIPEKLAYGGKTDDESRFRAAADDVRQAQAALSRIGPVPDQVRRALADRFQRATRRIADVTPKATGRS